MPCAWSFPLFWFCLESAKKLFHEKTRITLFLRQMKTRITIHERIDSVHCIVMVVTSSTFNYSIQIFHKEKLSPDSIRTESFLIFRPSSTIAAVFSIFIRIKADSNHLKSCPGVFFIRNTVEGKNKIAFHIIDIDVHNRRVRHLVHSSDFSRKIMRQCWNLQFCIKLA